MKIKKIILIFALPLFMLILIKVLFFNQKDYMKVYDIDNFKITEEYAKKTNTYHLKVIYNNIDYEFLINKEFDGKKIVNKIKLFEDEKEKCLILENKFNEDLISCSNNDLLISYNLVSDKLLKKLPSNFKINNTDNFNAVKDFKLYNKYSNKIFVWNYKGFDIILDGKAVDKKIFDKDIYDTNLISKINNFILIPNYNEKYNFDEIFILDIKKNKIIKWELDYEISMDSYILGIHNDSLFIVDKKNKIEFELVPHRKKIRIVATKNKKGIIYKDGEIEKVLVSKIINDNLKFSNSNIVNYKIKDNKLYFSYLESDNLILASRNATQIIDVNDDEVIYLNGNKLYSYKPNKGEYLLVEKDEWLFNADNKIFISFK